MPLWPKRKPRPGIDAYGRSPLWYFAAEGNISAVAKDCEAGADLNAPDDAGFTPLHVAAQNGQFDAVALLIRLGADCNALDKFGNGPLWTATHNACLAMATDRNSAIVHALLVAGANPNHCNNHNRSPFQMSERNPVVREIFISAENSND